jgi:hypothetical protein
MYLVSRRYAQHIIVLLPMVAFAVWRHRFNRNEAEYVVFSKMKYKGRWKWDKKENGIPDVSGNTPLNMQMGHTYNGICDVPGNPHGSRTYRKRDFRYTREHSHKYGNGTYI